MHISTKALQVRALFLISVVLMGAPHTNILHYRTSRRMSECSRQPFFSQGSLPKSYWRIRTQIPSDPLPHKHTLGQVPPSTPAHWRSAFCALEPQFPRENLVPRFRDPEGHYWHQEGNQVEGWLDFNLPPDFVPSLGYSVPNGLFCFVMAT